MNKNIGNQLLQAVATGDSRSVRSLLSESSDLINYADDQGMSLLHHAVASKRLWMVRLLLEGGASIQSDNKDRTPFDLAKTNNDEEVQRLLQRVICDQLWEAVTKGNISSLKSLLFKKAVEKGNIFSLKSLLFKNEVDANHINSGVDVNYVYYRNFQTTSLLKAAVEGEHEEIVALLLDNGANIKIKGRYRTNLLLLAIEQGNEKVVALVLKKLKEQSILINEQDTGGQTPLFVAASKGNTAIVSLIFNSGADTTIADRFGTTPLHEAVQRGNQEVVKLLLDEGVDATIANKLGDTPLHEAVLTEDESMVALLLTDEALINHQTNDGRTPLYGAALVGNVSIVRLLLDRGANLEIPEESGMTPLHGAAWRGHNDIVRLLLERGALITQDNKGRTPLHWVIADGCENASRLLLQHGAYAYYNQNDQIAVNWEITDVNESESLLYTHLILAGVAVPEEIALPEWLAKRKDLIDTTIINLLAPLKVSPTVSLEQARELAKAEYGPIVRWVLQLFPRLLKWVEATRKAAKQPASHDQKKAISSLDDLLSAVTVEDKPSQGSTDQSTMIAMLEAFGKELVLWVQDKSTAKTLVTGLKHYYPKIPPQVADYLVAEMLNDPKKKYPAFHKQLFDHTWATSLEPPNTPSREPHTRRLKP